MVNNIVTNKGLEFIANRMLGVTEKSFDTTNGTFTVSNGVNTCLATDTMTVFKADGDNYAKTITSSTYNSTTKIITTSCYLSSLEANLLGTITKFATDNDEGSGKLIQEHKFTAIPKNDKKELLFTLTITLADNS